jgi:hypothetical protein
MSKVLDPFRFVLIALSGWMNHRQYQVIDYLREENRVLRERLGDRRPRAIRRLISFRGFFQCSSGKCIIQRSLCTWSRLMIIRSGPTERVG